MSIQSIPVTEAKNRLTALLKNIRNMWDRIIITRNGRNEAVIISYEEYESWIETLSLSEEEKHAIREGRRAASRGDEVTLEDLLK